MPTSPHLRSPRFPVIIAVVLSCLQMLSGAMQAAALPAIEQIDSPTPAIARNGEVIAQTRRLLKERDTAGLEALADQLRNGRERLDGGTWILSTFYCTATDLPESEAEINNAIEFYERWARERPTSITAQVCLVHALTSFAWEARGGGWASSVSDDGWRLFRERLARARKVFDRASALEEKCPGLFEAAQTVALGQGWSRDQYMAALAKAIKQEPSYGKYYTNACYWLLPRWHGKIGDFEKWIASQADRYPKEIGDGQYAFFVWMADCMPVKGEIQFAPGRLDWARTKRGFDLWLKENPDNLMVRFEYTRLALLAADRATVRQQFEITGGKYYPRMWKDRKQFEQARQFAFANGSCPDIAPKKSRSTPKISHEALERVKLITTLVSGFIGGALAGICLLVLAIQRKQVLPGLVAMLVCVLLATPFGTVASIAPAGGLWLYLRRKHLVYPPEIAPPARRMIIIWLVVLSVLYVGLQLAAGIFACVPLVLEHGVSDNQLLSRLVVSDGSAFRIGINAAWISFLILLAICRPQGRVGWRDRLGFHRCPVLPGLIWSAVAFILAAGLGQLFSVFMDGRSDATLKLLALGLQSPASFYIALVLVAPVFEELLFRGYAYSGLIDRIPFWATVTITSLAFALCHVQYGVIGLINVFVLGVLLTALRRKTGSVYPCIAVHMAHNLVACLAA